MIDWFLLKLVAMPDGAAAATLIGMFLGAALAPYGVVALLGRASQDAGEDGAEWKRGSDPATFAVSNGKRKGWKEVGK